MANGTIAFDTLSTSGQIQGTAKSVDTDFIVSGSPKHWVNIDGDTPSARNSVKVVSELSPLNLCTAVVASKVVTGALPTKGIRLSPCKIRRHL